MSIIRVLLILIPLALLIGCEHDNKEKYIDFIKVSDKSYIGISEIQDSLDVPWDIQYNEGSNSIFFTEIKGSIFELDLKTNTKNLIYRVPNVFHKRTMGLLGLAIHPNFRNKPYLYACYTTEEEGKYYSELVKLKLEKRKVVQSDVLLRIPGALGHNGSRLTFDLEGYLYWATGDALSLTDSQDSTTLNGKILRMKDDGSIPKDNPLTNSYVYAWGFRNIQGLTVTSNGKIMASEHGDAIEDEVNYIQPLHNYGWREIEGYHDKPHEIEIARRRNMTEPIKAWTPVIAPAGMKYYRNSLLPEWDNSLLLVTLKTQSFRVLKLNEEQTNIIDEKVYLKDYYGRIRSVTSDKKGNIYIATSNRDWNPQKGFPKHNDDRILKLSVIDFKPDNFMSAEEDIIENKSNGKVLYKSYCASCHKDDGMGVRKYFPPLVQTATVESKNKFLEVVLKGLKGPIEVNGDVYDQEMPSFSFLSNSEITAISNYIRTGLGNNYSVIDTVDVNKMRMKIN
ncbi:PQQ-dependent sugar dehydrogenase [Sphingobacterium sp. UT-1RO-CII-1]|uniref:PQQ-dependent sugar dehydrogenase n=1 Tax=Sphingobacterium sp. UT-1RO-CII-1 TaxID=2995225 RepID=UPI00227B69B4|nr:PQQ-dependent sugar dehydrogenase [Sphingobacterium sp. UT-1RO-CII-1]MCY4779614.1 PQQ-dependent sugar dehydrogenase [Sphingobacterium sp. UT-1RO-CII-1]